MLRSLYRLGFDWEAIEYFAFVLDTLEQSAVDGKYVLQIMYGIGGERDLTERTLDNLTGYMGSRPVRVGNGAFDQQQLDVWGMLLDAICTQVRAVGRRRSPGPSGRAWPAWSTRRSSTGPRPTRGSGRSGGSPSTSRRPRSCAGWPSTGG